MKIAKNSVVALTYELKAGPEQGSIVEKVDEAEPFVFMFGNGQLLKDFEDQLSGLEAGKSFEFTIKASNAYGEFTPEAIIELPKSIFEENGPAEEGLLVIGNFLTLEDQHGNPLRGRIQNINADIVTMDFNHPLAGQDLHFKGGVIEVREATESELAHGHVHGAGGHHH